ncbi:MAG: divalent-cation tolerance protein CutA [Candidatus Eisenbacteria bacterium]|jgi:periplasmic divalent cation tolerance protein|nr:divalent-cation tolerance protein CutA [Candidatus Eisenbacteria bacterium]
MEHGVSAMDDGIMILVTASGPEEADRIASGLLEKRLVACANRVPGVSSRFWWNGSLDRAEECLLIMKSVRRLFESIRREVRAAHSYDVPEIIALPILEGDETYLSWIRDVVAPRA